jgi:hypothetical protein
MTVRCATSTAILTRQTSDWSINGLARTKIRSSARHRRHSRHGPGKHQVGITDFGLMRGRSARTATNESGVSTSIR